MNYQHIRAVSDTDILRLWDQGLDTCAISKQLWVNESVVANKLPNLLLRRRQDHEWNFDHLHSA